MVKLGRLGMVRAIGTWGGMHNEVLGSLGLSLDLINRCGSLGIREAVVCGLSMGSSLPR
jgi:hypothetical protein